MAESSHAQGPLKDASDPPRHNCDTPAAQLLERLADAWNAQDGAAFAAMFSPDATYVTGLGAEVSGREQIAALVAAADVARRGVVVRLLESGPVDESLRLDVAWRSTDAAGRFVCFVRVSAEPWLITHLRSVDIPA